MVAVVVEKRVEGLAIDGAAAPEGVDDVAVLVVLVAHDVFEGAADDALDGDACHETVGRLHRVVFVVVEPRERRAIIKSAGL